MRAIFEQHDSLVAAESGDLLDLERDVAADVNEDRSVRLVLPRLALEVLERQAEVVTVAVDELDVRATA